MKLHVLSNGVQCIDKSLMVAGYGQMTYNHPVSTTKLIEIPIHTFLIEHEEGLVLFDTACDPKWKKNWPEDIKELSPYLAKEEELLPNRLRQLGYTPEDVNYVVMSHLHNDHAGCLYMFKNAQIIVNDVELTNTVHNYVTKESLNVHVASDVKAMIDADLNWRPVKDDEKEWEFLKGLTILNLGSGHAWGMLALKIELKNSGNILLAADAIYTSENYGPPVKNPGIVYDTLGYEKSAKEIRAYAEKYNCTVLFGHDIEQFNTLRKAPDEYYD